MDLVSRLKIYMEHVGLQISQFADAAQIPRPTLSQILSGRNRKISNELLEKLHSAFPLLNISWLLFGDGAMEIAAKTSAQQDPSSIAKSNTPNKAVQTADEPKQEGKADTGTSNKQNETQKTEEEQTTTKNATTSIEADPWFMVEDIANADDTSRQSISIQSESTKNIQTIVVFYTDKSYEIFKPTVRY